MRSDSNLDGVAGPFISARVRKTILSIKEIVGNHSDADIYAVLKETNMDPNETAQKLLNQDPFHEVRRRRDKRKGVIAARKDDKTYRSYKGSQRAGVGAARLQHEGICVLVSSSARRYTERVAGFVSYNWTIEVCAFHESSALTTKLASRAVLLE
ncbi:hypothetical protein HPP92_018746 [Vanilla planifolia]|uniref:GBF-interacting protein 1 N-terminal domain-containing protein n=1 Tax=Vanilla planifolia TaxID=51239 RepID=A0A835Q869_VANPL|nr:hypothetical protein HPP92_019328 [Vanilla planifolia]KAG0464582.1 hypothetical protein HPP92_018746 [Vanilla planifolia]